MEYHELKINLAELAMVLTALGAIITAWRGGKAVKDAKKQSEAEKGEEKHGAEDNPGG